MLQTFIQNMLPKDTEAVYGKGMSGDMWKSMMADKLADVMSDRGGIGIADRLLADHYRDGDKTTLRSARSRAAPNAADADQQSMLSTRARPGDAAQADQRRSRTRPGSPSPPRTASRTQPMTDYSP